MAENTYKTENAIKDKYFILLILATAFFYLPVLIDLISAWYHNPNYSHGFLVAPVAVYLIWKNRQEIGALPVTGSSVGLIVIILAVLLFIFGNGASEAVAMALSLVMMICGIILYHFGTEIFKKTWFAVVFLLFMIPVPEMIYLSIVAPIYLPVAKAATSMLNLIGMPIVFQGDIINLPHQALNISEACSGMRSLVALLAMGTLYAYLSHNRSYGKVLIFILTVPSAVIAYIIQVSIVLVVIYTSDGLTAADEPLHSIMNTLLFAVTFLILLIFGAVLRRAFR
nr:exosortase [candidate division Zixibacteria bacterium]